MTSRIPYLSYRPHYRSLFGNASENENLGTARNLSVGDLHGLLLGEEIVKEEIYDEYGLLRPPTSPISTRKEKIGEEKVYDGYACIGITEISSDQADKIKASLGPDQELVHLARGFRSSRDYVLITTLPRKPIHYEPPQFKEAFRRLWQSFRLKCRQWFHREKETPKP